MAKKENPFTAKARGNLKAFGSGGKNTKIKSLEKLPLGSQVRVTWKIDSAYGEGIGSFAGEVVKVNDWLTLVNSSGTKFHYPFFLFDSVEEI